MLTRVLNLNGISIGAAVFAGLTSETDRLTDRPTHHGTRSVTIGRIYVRSTAMRPNKQKNTKNPWPYPAGDRLAKHLSKKISASFKLTGQPVSGKFLLGSR